MYFLRKVVKHPASSLFVSQTTSFIIPWLITIWLAFQNKIDQLAEFSFVLAIVSPFTLILTAPSRNYMLSSSALNEGQSLYIRLNLIILGLMSVLAFTGLVSYIPMLFVVFIYKTSEFLFDFRIVQGIKKKKVSVLWNVVTLKVIAITVVSVFVYSLGLLDEGLLLLSFIFAVFALFKKKVEPIKTELLYKTLKSVLPLSVSALVFSIYFNIPRYVLGYEALPLELAVYTISSFLCIGMLVIVNALCQSKLHFWTEVLSDKKINVLISSIKKVVLLIIALYLLLQLFHVPYFFDLFWSLHNDVHQNNYKLLELSRLIVLLSFGPVLFSVANYALMVANKHNLLLSLVLVNTVVTTLLCVMFFQKDSIDILIWIMALSGLIHFFISTYVSFKTILSK